MSRTELHEDDFLYELKDILTDAVDNRRWASAEEALEMVCEQLGEESAASTEDEEDY